MSFPVPDNLTAAWLCLASVGLGRVQPHCGGDGRTGELFAACHAGDRVDMDEVWIFLEIVSTVV